MYVLVCSWSINVKCKITPPNKTPPKKTQNGKSHMKCKNQKLKHIKRMDNNCVIPYLVQAFPYVDNAGLNLVLKLDRPLTSMKEGRKIPEGQWNS